MLYVYYGDDIDMARKKVRATVSTMRARNPDALYFRITGDTLREYDVNELTGSQALFKSEYIVVFDRVLESKEGKEILLAHLETIASSIHPFFVLDTKLSARVRTMLEKHAATMQEFTVRGTAPRHEHVFNTFSLTDALAAHDTKKLWVLFREAKYHGVSDEEIHGVLFWMYKSMLLAAHSTSPEEAGMKPYPYRKAKRGAQRAASSDTVREKLAELALLPQRARRRGVPLEVALERFILSP